MVLQRHTRLARAALILSAAAWGMVVDGNFIPILAPTSNSTLFQASTAAAFALLGIIFGPLMGSLGGLIRDGSSAVVTIAAHPGMITSPDFLRWSIQKSADIFEDVMLGLIPGLTALRTDRVPVLAGSAAGAAWISLPFLVICNTLADGRVGGIWTALTTAVGDWDEPVDPGLTVYALLTGGMVAFALGVRADQSRVWLPAGILFIGAALVLIAAGAHS